MTFLHPTLLAAGLAALAIPIVIHFFLRRKRRPVRWAAMRFLLEAYRKHQRRRKLEQFLLLALRCLVVALLAVAIARPIFGPPADASARTLALVIDNSILSTVTDESGRTALQRHLDEAAALLDGLSPARGDRVAIVPAAAPVRALIASPTIDHDAARRALAELEPTDSGADLPAAIAAAAALADADQPPLRVAVLAGWRAGSLPDQWPSQSETSQSSPRPDRPSAPAAFSLVASTPDEDPAPNLRVIAFDPGRAALFPADTPAARQALVSLRRDGESLPALDVSLTAEALSAAGEPERRETARAEFAQGQREATATIALPASSLENADVAIRLTAAPLNTAPAFSDRVTPDSTALRGIRLRDAARVGVVHARRAGRPLGSFDSADWLRAALRPEPSTPVEIREISAPGLRGADLAGLDAAFITRPDLVPDAAWTDLARFHQLGGTLVFVPPAGEAIQQWPDRLEQAIGFSGSVSREADSLDAPARLSAPAPPGEPPLPMLAAELDGLARGVTVSRLLRVTGEPEAVVLATDADRPVLLRTADRAWLFAAPLETGWTDLPAKPLFVPLVQEIVRQSAAPARPATVAAGRPVALPPGTIELLAVAGPARLPINPDADTTAPARAGVYVARDARGQTLGTLAVTPDARRSDTTPTPPEEILAALRVLTPDGEADWLADTVADDEARAAPADDTGSWIYFLIAALLALSELVLARFASHAGQAAVSPRRGAEA